VRHFSKVPRESPPLGLKSKCSTAEARHSRALAESTADASSRGGFSRGAFEKFAFRKIYFLFLYFSSFRSSSSDSKRSSGFA